ncbi:MAG: hypothetical protein JW812_01580 [Alphaproteobacteria bacterium]|nr:hypothetical protein [Alphaproteobacteria bacterium]MBN2780032.1 hypothetical protein [Alphaproteobacteria bacterium]
MQKIKNFMIVLPSIFSGILLIFFTHLFCCGLPALLSIVGVSVSGFGFLETQGLELYKNELFVLGGIILFGALYVQWRDHHSCPINGRCAHTKRIAKVVLIGTIALYIASIYLAFFYYPSCAHGALPPLPLN